MKNAFRTVIALLLGLGMAGCVSVPEQLAGEYTALSPDRASELDANTPVRWGGVLLETRPESDRTCFEILSRPLQRSMRPETTDQASGRFIACKTGFHDPEVFKKGREVTLTGTFVYMDVSMVGEYEYHYPVVEVTFMTLWPKRRMRERYDFYGYYEPYYWHYPRHRLYFWYPY